MEPGKGVTSETILCVLNSILHVVSNDKKKKIDIEIYGIEKFFDKMWPAETANDLCMGYTPNLLPSIITIALKATLLLQ